MHYKPYRDLLLELFPNYLKVRKLPLNGGMSCPNLDGTKGFSGCSYCNNRSFSPVFDEAKVSIQEQLEKYVPKLREKYPNAGILAYLQPYTNTHAPLEHLREIIDPIIKHKEIAGLAIGTRPDCLEDEKIQLLRELNAIKPVWVELGLQTTKPESVRYIRRGYENAVFADAVKALREEGIYVIAHIILGLPGETEADMESTLRFALACGVNGVKLQLLHVLEGTDLAEDWRAGKFRTLTLEEYLHILSVLLPMLPPDVAVHRLTGDGAKKDLLSPLWSADKKTVLNAINALTEN